MLTSLTPAAFLPLGAPSSRDESRLARQPTPESAVRRSFMDTRDGQLHLRLVMPANATNTPCLCIHHTPVASRSFLPLLRRAGATRMALAPDLAGHGDSDIPPTRPTIGDHAWTMGRIVDQLGIREIDVIGHGAGAVVAVELARSRPAHVRRLVLVSPPPAGTTPPARPAGPTPDPATPDAGWVSRLWQARLAQRGAQQTPTALWQTFVEELRLGDRAAWYLDALSDYLATSSAAAVEKPTLVLAPDERLWTLDAGEHRSWPVGARVTAVPDLGPDALGDPTDRLSTLILAFLDE
ncbi:MAG: alpha/beta hydrolase [Vicinamibacterales bacterium]